MFFNPEVIRNIYEISKFLKKKRYNFKKKSDNPNL